MGGGAGREGYNGLPLEKRNCQLCLLCQQAMSANPVAAPHRSPTARQPVSHQPTVVSYQSFVLSPHSSVLGPPSTVLCPPSAVRCLCWVVLISAALMMIIWIKPRHLLPRQVGPSGQGFRKRMRRKEQPPLPLPLPLPLHFSKHEFPASGSIAFAFANAIHNSNSISISIWIAQRTRRENSSNWLAESVHPVRISPGIIK